MGKLFGTDGIRGIVGENLTADLAYRVGQAVTAVLFEEKGRKPLVTIGMDTRISSDMLEGALIAGICSAGGDVMPLGTIPTPAVAYLTIKVGADAGVVISASHNPFEHNGIKVFNGEGYKLSDALEERVEEKILSGENMATAKGGDIGKRIHGMKNLKYEYIKHLLGTVEDNLGGLRILVDCANGAAAATAPDLFAKFDIEADFIHRKPNGVNINDRCGSTHLKSLSAMVTAGEYDLGVAFDGDADRCLMIDERGNVIDGDKTMAVCGLDMKNRGLLTGLTIVGTVMSNLGLHEFCNQNGLRLVCTAVGDRNVLEKMLEKGYRIGGEQSGHMIFSDYATTGDGQLTALQFLQILRRSGRRASELVSVCPQYPQVLENVRLENVPGLKERVMDAEALRSAIRQEEAAMAGEGRVLVRASGTEPLIRVMVEAKTAEMAAACAGRLVELVNIIKK
ncbi:MAG: phosphoglucosamine mutase [Oscillospiraceae bacterium]|jgi:phosphoglucosamine mutase|nr:phosphoglucosamine mutase [Oscillospiraceae bacterium]MCI9586922.1 phosphoglucosamine mutase [Oscillospiraceae bacterium]